MKTEQKIFFKKVNSQVENTTHVVEVSAADKVENNRKKIFCSADLWNIQRRKKVTLVRY